ncbi:unnamed protein product, partial [Didymodactylos carnosus]
KYEEIRKRTEKYEEVRRSTRSTEKYGEVRRSTKKYGKYGEVRRSTRSTEVRFFPLATTTPKTPLPHEKKMHSIGASLMQFDDHSTKRKMKREDEYKGLMSMQEKKLILKTEEVEAAKTMAHAIEQLVELQKIQLSVQCEQVKISSRLYEIQMKTTNPDYNMKEDQTLNQTVLNLIVPIDT